MRLALGLTGRPGGTAVLAGAGVSVAAGVPAAWEVQEALLRRAATASGADPEDVFVWWRDQTGEEARYDDVLYATAPTPSARFDLLRPFFEPTAEEREAGVKVPSAAHRALARLMRDGFVRIIITLNFDLLIETALRDLGIEPTVVSTPADVEGMEPLHAQRYLVWHLHGDYTNPQMLNTPDELRAYPDSVRARLGELFDQYGLLVLGWSATWDPALREALSSTSSRRYPTTWLDVRDLGEDAARLADQRDATVVNATAEDWLTGLVDACTLVRERTTDPLSTLALTATVKRDLAARRRPVMAHDQLEREADRLAGLSVFSANEVTLGQASPYASRIGTAEAGLERWAALIATLAYWGDEETDRWWTDHIGRFGAQPALNGYTDAINLLKAPAVVALYTGGAAAAAAGRWDLVARLLTGFAVPTVQGAVVPAAVALDPATMYPHRSWPSRALCRLLEPVMTGALGLSSTAARDGWETFEYLAYAVAVDRIERKQPANLVRPLPYLRISDDYVRKIQGAPVIRRGFEERTDAPGVLVPALFEDEEQRFHEALDKADQWIEAAADRIQTSGMVAGRGYFLETGVRYPAIAEDGAPTG